MNQWKGISPFTLQLIPYDQLPQAFKHQVDRHVCKCIRACCTPAANATFAHITDPTKLYYRLVHRYDLGVLPEAQRLKEVIKKRICSPSGVRVYLDLQLDDFVSVTVACRTLGMVILDDHQFCVILLGNMSHSKLAKLVEKAEDTLRDSGLRYYELEPVVAAIYEELEHQTKIGHYVELADGRRPKAHAAYGQQPFTGVCYWCARPNHKVSQCRDKAAGKPKVYVDPKSATRDRSKSQLPACSSAWELPVASAWPSSTGWAAEAATRSATARMLRR